VIVYIILFLNFNTDIFKVDFPIDQLKVAVKLRVAYNAFTLYDYSEEGWFILFIVVVVFLVAYLLDCLKLKKQKISDY